MYNGSEPCVQTQQTQDISSAIYIVEYNLLQASLIISTEKKALLFWRSTAVL
jgi:hypothetical protein